MRIRAATAAATCGLALLGASGCGGRGGGSAAAGPDPNDKRAVALICIREAGLPARLAGEKSIQVDGLGGPKVEFFVSSGEAEGKQFQGGAQAAEHIGAALLFVNQASEEQLMKVETCLEDQ